MFTPDGELADRAIGIEGRTDWLISMPQTGPQIDRQGLFIEIRGSDLHLAIVTVPPTNGPVELVTRVASEEEAADQLRTMLRDRGLTTAEVDGLIEAWWPHFFRTAGARFIMLMTARDYDTLNPIAIRPAPTQLVRVGIILTEFGA